MIEHRVVAPFCSTGPHVFNVKYVCEYSCLYIFVNTVYISK